MASIKRTSFYPMSSYVDMLGDVGSGPRKAADLLKKKIKGDEFTWEDIDFFIKGFENGTITKTQAGAMLTSLHFSGLSILECESFMKAMMFSGEILDWPGEWSDSLASLQSIGATGNKAKPVVAAAMAALGLKFPIMSTRGADVFNCILNKFNTIPNFEGNKSDAEMESILRKVGCCLVKQPASIAPAETHIRDTAFHIGLSDNNSIKAACLMARVCAFKLRAVVLEITCGPSESINCRSEATDLVQKLQEMAKVMGVRCKVILTHVDGPVGRMIGQSLGVAEVIHCFTGDGPDDFRELVCKLGGHVLHEMNKAKDPKEGEHMVEKVLKNGSAKKKFMQMLEAQGVHKSIVKDMFKHSRWDTLPEGLPVARSITYLTAEMTGYVHRIDTTTCNRVMFELSRKQADGEEVDEDNVGRSCAGGIHLLVQIGSYLNRGENWAKVHHNVPLNDSQLADLKEAVTISMETPLYDMTIDMQEVYHSPDSPGKPESPQAKELCSAVFGLQVNEDDYQRPKFH